MRQWNRQRLRPAAERLRARCYPAKFSRRVGSWLRTNAGGVLNTCKWSDEPGFGLGQSRERVSNTWVTCPDDRDNPRKLGLIPDVPPAVRPTGKGSFGFRIGIGPRPISLLVR